MKSDHLDDSKIQNYVLQSTKCDVEIIEHIDHCVSCKTMADQYRILIEGIVQQEKPSFDFDLSALILKQITKPSPKYSIAILVVYLLTIVGFISFLIVFYQFRISILNVFASSSVLVITIIILSIFAITSFQFIEFYKKHQRQMDILNTY